MVEGVAESGAFSGSGVPMTPSQTPDQLQPGAGEILSGAKLFAQPPQVQSGAQLFGALPSPQPSVLSGKELFGPSEGKETATALGVDPKTYDAVANPVSKTVSMVGKVTAPLAYPLRAETSAVMGAAQMLGLPGAKEWNDKFNPTKSILPDAYLHDITDFYIDKASQAAGLDSAPDMMRNAVRAAKFGVGLAADFVGDPLMALSVGSYTKQAEMIQKMGGTLNEAGSVSRDGLLFTDANARNLLTYKVPLSKTVIEIQGKPIQEAVKKLGDLPPVRTVADWIKALSPDTGDPVLDIAGRTHDSLKRGDPTDIINRYMAPKHALQMTSDEDRLASALVESSPNLRPDLPETHLKAASKNPAFWGDEGSIRSHMGLRLEETAKKLGVELAPGRETAILDAAMMAKRGGAENLMDKFHAGVLTEDNIAEKVIESHLKHEMNPSYRGVKDLAEYQKRLAQDESEVNKMVTGTFLSSKDITRQREVLGTLEEANAKMLDQKGLGDYFIHDPVAATTADLIRSKKLLRDSQYLDVVKDYGTAMDPKEALKQGRVAISHPDLSGKRIAIPNKNDSTMTGRVFKHADLVYPKDIASKVQSRLGKPALTGVVKTLSDYNKVFRSVIFMSSPGIRIGNALDNVFKTIAITGKDFVQASKDATAVLLGKSEGFRSIPTALRPQGVFYDGATLKSLVDRYGLTKSGAWSEGMESFMQAGKKMTLSDAMQRPSQLLPRLALDKAKSMIRWVDTFGEHGENSAKVALFLQRLRAGYEPEMAASEVTKWLFDYNRNSPATEVARYILPFVQHPLKTAMIAPQLLGTAPGAYNFIQNTFPKVLANAFHDPVSQTEINTILPDNIKQRDGIIGPFIPGNTWLAAILSKPGGKLGSVPWFDPRIGLRIINHFDYLSKGGTDRLIGETSPILQGLLGIAGRGDFGKSLDYANGNVNVANRFNYAIGKIIGGVAPFPNAEKLLMQKFGLVDPDHIEPATVLVMKGLAGQFGGITDLDRDVHLKLLSAHYAYMDQKKQFVSAAAKEAQGNLAFGRFGSSLRGMDSVTLFKEMNKASQEGAEAQLGAQAIGSGMTAADFVVRMKGLSDTMRQLNQAYQTMGTAKLQMKEKGITK